MNRRFRLTAVEKLRAGKLSDAGRALSRARREVAEALNHRERIRAELQQTVAAWRSSPSEQNIAAARRLKLREELTLAGERCTAARSQELAALATWSAARADLRAVELLHERHRALLAEKDARAEQREVDDLAALSRRWAAENLADEGSAAENPVTESPVTGGEGT
jgi:flagellar biosynthesis chaperone FliJ